MGTIVELIKGSEEKKVLWQWDTGRQVKIVPEKNTTVDEVHFSNVFFGEALVVEPKVSEETGDITADIPNILLQYVVPIDIYIVMHLPNGECTTHRKTMEVRFRKKPSDCVYTETEIRNYEALEKRIRALEEGGTGEGIKKEIDPTVPDWAKQPEKPTYTAEEVGAVSDTTVLPLVLTVDTKTKKTDKTAKEIHEIAESGIPCICMYYSTPFVYLQAINMHLEDYGYVLFNYPRGDSNQLRIDCEGNVTVQKTQLYTQYATKKQQGLVRLGKGFEKPNYPDVNPYLVDNAMCPAKAEVGQIIKITEVDENGVPTAVEAVDMTALGTTEFENVNVTDMTGYLLKSGGNVVESSTANVNRLVSEPIYANAGETYLFSCSANYGNALYVIYNMAGESIAEVVADATVEGNVLEQEEIVMPEDTYYFRLASNLDIQPEGYSANKVVNKDISSMIYPLLGKKWVVVGDSLTEKNIRTTKNYHDYVAKETGVTVVNMGVSGSGYKNGEEDGEAFYQRAANIPADADIITIFGSGNDRNLDLGSPTDTGTDTVCGCINTTIDTIQDIAPLARLNIASPTPWKDYPPFEVGNKMDLYSQALGDICRLRGIPFLDLYHCSGLRPWDEAFLNVAYTKDVTDGVNSGVHPDENGHAMISPVIKALVVGANDVKSLNPKKLTFTGAVTAEYDGSGAVTVTIPDGSVERIKKLSTDTEVELQPNKLYIFPEMESLSVDLAEPEKADIVNEYHFVFQSGETVTTLAFPDTVNIPSSFSVDVNKIYEISIMENCLAYQSWEVTT